MHKYLNFSKSQLIRFILLSAIMLFFYFEGMISLILLLFFEILFLIRFIHVKKYLESKILNHYPAYEHLPGWAKWIVILIMYLIIFMIFKWIIVNIILEGIFHIPINSELQGMSAKLANSS